MSAEIHTTANNAMITICTQASTYTIATHRGKRAALTPGARACMSAWPTEATENDQTAAATAKIAAPTWCAMKKPGTAANAARENARTNAAVRPCALRRSATLDDSRKASACCCARSPKEIGVKSAAESASPIARTMRSGSYSPQSETYGSGWIRKRRGFVWT